VTTTPQNIADRYGSVLPAIDFTAPMSEEVTFPSAVTSERKFVCVTGLLASDFTRPTSLELTALFPSVSPKSAFIINVVSGIVCEKLSVTPLNVIATRCAFGTPLRRRVILSPAEAVLETLPVPSVTAALPRDDVVAEGKRRSCDRHFRCGATRHLVDRRTGRLMSNVPASPCVLRETALTAASACIPGVGACTWTVIGAPVL
jgi:hypothetical protein